MSLELIEIFDPMLGVETLTYIGQSYSARREKSNGI